jgi:hypothetical protein
LSAPIDTLLARLEGVRPKGSNQWSCKCPAHADRSPSLSIKFADDGTILINCFAGCDANDVLAAVGMNIRDLFPKPLAHSIFKKRRGLSAFDALRAMRHELSVVQFIAEDISNGQRDELLLRRAQLAAARIQTALDLCDG